MGMFLKRRARMHPFNEMLIYLGSEVWMSRIPSFRFNKGYSKHKSQGLEGPGATRNSGRSRNCPGRVENVSRGSAMASAPHFQLSIKQSQIEPGQDRWGWGCDDLAVLWFWKPSVIRWRVFRHGLRWHSPPILASYNFSDQFCS